MSQSMVPHHIAYVVEDIEEAAWHWATKLGAGPFLQFERVVFDEVTHFDQPCVFDHSAAFGQWGPIAIELQQIYASSPPSLTERLIPARPPVPNHLAYISATPDTDSARLSAAGNPLFLHARFGEIEVRFHDTVNSLGQAIEIHRQCAALDAVFSEVAGLSRGWDGRKVLRPIG